MDIKLIFTVGVLLLIEATAISCRTESLDYLEEKPQGEDLSLQMVGMPQEAVSEIIEYPGFVVSFNAEHHIPNWVAWELTGEESQASEANRNQATFLPDVKVAGCSSLADYKYSGYERGHMCPAGDMKWSLEAMNACFLLTNICPQKHDLNSGAWNTLENKCREWALRDSAIVVICGPILSDAMPEKIGENRVSVPERFFKVILAPFANPPRAIGFVMNNGYVEGGMQASALSVDEVEAITGFDFFAQLPDPIEAEVEKQCNFPLWSQRSRNK